LCQSKLTYTPVDIDLHKEEFRRPVLLVSNYHGFSQEGNEEALALALADPVDALICYTSLARQVGLP
jgi:predicted nucleic acid-binding protein